MSNVLLQQLVVCVGFISAGVWYDKNKPITITILLLLISFSILDLFIK